MNRSVNVNIDKLLKINKRSKKWLYEQTGISRSNINHIANGHTSSIKFETILKLCDVFNCTPGELITIVNSNEKNK